MSTLQYARGCRADFAVFLTLASAVLAGRNARNGHGSHGHGSHGWHARSRWHGKRLLLAGSEALCAARVRSGSTLTLCCAFFCLQDGPQWPGMGPMGGMPPMMGGMPPMMGGMPPMMGGGPGPVGLPGRRLFVNNLSFETEWRALKVSECTSTHVWRTGHSCRMMYCNGACHTTYGCRVMRP